MLMKMIMRIVVLFSLVTIVGCSTFDAPIRNFCDKELAYRLWKKDTSYHLDLEVGQVGKGACRTGLYYDREINVSQDVSSPEEADKLIDKYRREYAEKVTVVKPTAHVPELPKLPAKVRVVKPPTDQCVTPDQK